MPLDAKLAADAIASVRSEIETVDQDTMSAVVGVCEALNDLTQALEDVDVCLYRRQFEAAANLGYRSVSSGYVFLQRTLGELNTLEGRKALIVQKLARELRCAYEEISPHVDAVMESLRPPPLVTIEAAAAHSAMVEAIRAKFCEIDDEGDADADDDTGADDIDDDAEISGDAGRTSNLNFDRALGFGSTGSRKARALLRAVKPLQTSEYSIQLPKHTWEEIQREAKRVGVTGAQIIQAAIACWTETNPKKARMVG